MRFKKIYGFILMKAGTTQNGLEVGTDIIKESIIHHEFDNAPIVFNENQSFKDYRDNVAVDNFIRQKVVGVVLPDTVDFDGIHVTGDVMLQEEFVNRTHFDNWCIEFDENKSSFRYNSCELFSKKETDSF